MGHSRIACFGALITALLLTSQVRGQEPGAAGPSPGPTTVLAQTIEVAPVTIDGRALFPVRGVQGYPAERRASEIADRIRDAARDPSVRTADIRIEETDDGVRVLTGERLLLMVFDADAVLDGVDAELLALVRARLIGEAIDEWRRARTPRNLLAGAAIATGGAVALIFVLWFLRRLYMGLGAFFDRRVARRIKDITVQDTEIVRGERIRSALLGAMRTLIASAAVVLGLVYVKVALGAFPWTRAASDALFGWVVAPIAAIGQGILDAIPGLLFILVAALFTRFVLGAIKAFFVGVERGTSLLQGFDPEWARPTYKLIRVLILVLFVVIIYPYIPGSSSEAFKGISIFIGIILSLGSTALIGNLVSGYGMVYRRAFRIGDRVSIDGSFGEVVDRRLLVTHLRSPKNEEIIVPNAQIMNGVVVNYSSLAREEGLILHTSVGIGYETPWRQVEAMLLEAVRRTSGLDPEPPPFVLQKELGDFAVVYEVNAYTRDPRGMLATYTRLHANILDVFNEYGVQIMTPAYEDDPEVPKVVAATDWYAPPAVPGAPPATPATPATV